MKSKLMLLLALLVFGVGMVSAQTKKISGKVIDEDGLPVIGAVVMVDGTQIGASTNNDGVYTILNAPADVKVLRVSCVGMETRKVSYKEGQTIMLESNSVLNEVLVQAYGTVKRAAFTGSIAEVKSEDITKHVGASATSSLVGKVAGVTTTTSSGAPGSGPTVRIRGIGSMSAGSAPLYIVDGAPLGGSVTDINPNDIETISVLKDASATAIYGARGANGVILITTKRAKLGDTKVNFDAKWGSNSRLVPNYDVISNPAEYYETIYRGLYNSQAYHGASAAQAYAYADKYLLDRNNGGVGYQVYTIPEGEKMIGTNFKLNPKATLGYTDGEYYYTPDNWYDEAFHNSFRQEYNASVSGAKDRLNYYAGLGYLDDGGIVNNSNYQRYSARTNVDYQVTKWMRFTSNMGFTHAQNQSVYTTDSYGSSGDMFYIANTMGPIYPLYVRNADGTIKKEAGRTIYDRGQTNQKRPSVVGNAIGDNEADRRMAYKDYFNGKWAIDITPFEGLRLTAALTAESSNTRSNTLQSPFASAASVDGAVSVSHSRFFTTNQQYLANYNTTIAEKHNIAVLLGYEQYNVKTQSLSGYNTRLFSPFIGELNNALGKADMSTSSSSDKFMSEGFLGRLSYDFAEKYFVSGSIRRDASSRFAPGHQWGTFGSVGAAWVMNKENFLKDAKWIDMLKLKVAYGTQGNDDIIGYHAYADRYTTSYNEETGEYSVTMSAKGNEKLTWEASKQLNAGVEFSFFKNRLNGTIEWYKRATSDMLYRRSVPLSSGLSVSSYPVNIGSMYNTGVEITIDGDVIRTKNVNWNINLNLTSNKNKITKLDPTVPKEGLIYSNQILREGGSIYETYMKKYAGVDHETGEALYYKEVKHYDDKEHPELLTSTTIETTKNITEATQFECGSTLPKVTGGFGTTLAAYGIDVSAQFSFSLGGQMYDGGYQQSMGLSQVGSNLHRDILKAWTPDNKDSNIPRLSTAAADDGLQVSSQTPLDYFLTSSNYLCLSNLTVGYTLPKNWTRKFEVSALRLYFSGENLFLLTARKGLDPRFNYGMGSMTSGSGLANGYYSAGRAVTAGISVTF